MFFHLFVMSRYYSVLYEPTVYIILKFIALVQYYNPSHVVPTHIKSCCVELFSGGPHNADRHCNYYFFIFFNQKPKYIYPCKRISYAQQQNNMLCRVQKSHGGVNAQFHQNFGS